MGHDEAETKPIGVISPIGGGFIVSTPGICNGEPRIAGTRIKVRHVYVWVEQQGMSGAQVVENYPHLSRSAVHTALAYYWSHADQIQNAIDAEDHLVTDMKFKNARSFRPGITDFRGRLFMQTLVSSISTAAKAAKKR